MDVRIAVVADSAGGEGPLWPKVRLKELETTSTQLKKENPSNNQLFNNIEKPSDNSEGFYLISGLKFLVSALPPAPG